MANAINGEIEACWEDVCIAFASIKESWMLTGRFARNSSDNRPLKENEKAATTSDVFADSIPKFSSFAFEFLFGWINNSLQLNYAYKRLTSWILTICLPHIHCAFYGFPSLFLLSELWFVLVPHHITAVRMSEKRSYAHGPQSLGYQLTHLVHSLHNLALEVWPEVRISYKESNRGCTFFPTCGNWEQSV